MVMVITTDVLRHIRPYAVNQTALVRLGWEYTHLDRLDILSVSLQHHRIA